MNIILGIDFTTKNMAEVLFNIRMVRNILDTSATTISMDMASLLIDLATYMRVNDNIIIERAMALICIKMVINMRVNLNMMCLVGRENCNV